jgi:hypothetical protein
LLVYWLLFAYFAVGTMLQRRSRVWVSTAEQHLFLGGVVIVALLVGLRYEVGGDWGTYERMFAVAGFGTLDQNLIGVSDPAYRLLNWSVHQVGGDIWLVNLVCAVIFSWGLFRFTKMQPDPWLAMLVAIPYLVIVVAMGYSRQGVAIGVLMAGLASLQSGASIVKFALYVAAASLFHKTALVALPLAVAIHRNSLVNVLVCVAATALLYGFVLEDAMDRLVTNYIGAQAQSQGAAIRVAMSLVPATVFLFEGKRFGLSREKAALWRNFSIAAFGFLILLVTLASSTVVDRLALYVLPLQIVVLSRIPGTLMSYEFGRLVIILYSIAVLFVWLNYADYSTYWLPYQFYPFAR